MCLCVRERETKRKRYNYISVYKYVLNQYRNLKNLSLFCYCCYFDIAIVCYVMFVFIIVNSSNYIFKWITSFECGYLFKYIWPFMGHIWRGPSRLSARSVWQCEPDLCQGKLFESVLSVWTSFGPGPSQNLASTEARVWPKGGFWHLLSSPRGL